MPYVCERCNVKEGKKMFLYVSFVYIVCMWYNIQYTIICENLITFLSFACIEVESIEGWKKKKKKKKQEGRIWECDIFCVIIKVTFSFWILDTNDDDDDDDVGVDDETYTIPFHFLFYFVTTSINLIIYLKCYRWVAIIFLLFHTYVNIKRNTSPFRETHVCNLSMIHITNFKCIQLSTRLGCVITTERNKKKKVEWKLNKIKREQCIIKRKPRHDLFLNKKEW